MIKKAKAKETKKLVRRSLGEGGKVVAKATLAKSKTVKKAIAPKAKAIKPFDTSAGSVSSRARSRDDKSSGFYPERSRGIKKEALSPSLRGRISARSNLKKGLPAREPRSGRRASSFDKSSGRSPEQSRGASLPTYRYARGRSQ